MIPARRHQRRRARIQWAVAVLGALSLTVIVSACGSGSSSASTSSSSPGSDSALSGKSVVYIDGVSHSTYQADYCGIKSEAERYGMDLSLSEPTEFAPSAQIPLVSAAIAKRPDALIVTATDPKALVTPLQQASERGIKVFTVSNTIEDPSFLTASVIGNNEEVGQVAAEVMAKELKGQSGEIGYIGYEPGGSLITDAREKGFYKQIKKYPNLDALPPVVSKGIEASGGAAAADALISAHPNLLGIVGSYIHSSTGMAQVLVERGLQGNVVAEQLDADTKGIEYLKEGVFNAIPAEPFYEEGQKVMQQVANSLEGKPVIKEQELKPKLFTTTNVESPAMQKFVANPEEQC